MNETTVTTTTTHQVIASNKSNEELCQGRSSSTVGSQENVDILKSANNSSDKLFFKSKKEKVEFSILILGIILSMFMMSLNSTVVAPAMSIIATELDALESQTWIATAYLVALNAFQPLSGRVRGLLYYLNLMCH